MLDRPTFKYKSTEQFYDELWTQWDLDLPHQRMALKLIAECLDLAEDARLEILERGSAIRTERGSYKVNPAVHARHQALGRYRQLLGDLGLENELDPV
jgi:hypothetical protein